MAEVPVYFLRTFPGADIDADVYRDVAKAIEDANARQRKKRKRT